jgi:hypothetical protein
MRVCLFLLLPTARPSFMTHIPWNLSKSTSKF